MPTVGRTRELHRLFTSLEAQFHAQFRVIVVDQNPDNRLDDVLSEIKRFPVLYLRSQPGLSHARNVGLRHIDADVVAFPDDDCWYPPDLLERVADLLAADTELGGVTGRTVDEDGRPSGGRWSRRPGPVTRFNVWTRANSASIFLRTSAFGKDLWFDETMGLGPNTTWPAGEDFDFIVRAIQLGCRVHYEPTLRVFHERTREDVATPDREQGYSYGLGMGRALRKAAVPWWFGAYLCGRSFGGAGLSLVRGSTGLARFHWAVGRGRVRGWRSTGVSP